METYLSAIGEQSGAKFSECRRYRYTLWRCWNVDLPKIAFAGLNPSTADASKLDPTCTRCIDFASRWGFGTYIMLNLFAYRSTDPAGLRLVEDPVGACNDECIELVTQDVDCVVAAWGAHSHPLLKARAEHVLSLVPNPKCLGTTKGGSPRHPLYVPGNTELVEYQVQPKAIK